MASFLDRVADFFNPTEPEEGTSAEKDAPASKRSATNISEGLTPDLTQRPTPTAGVLFWNAVRGVFHAGQDRSQDSPNGIGGSTARHTPVADVVLGSQPYARSIEPLADPVANVDRPTNWGSPLTHDSPVQSSSGWLSASAVPVAPSTVIGPAAAPETNSGTGSLFGGASGSEQTQAFSLFGGASDGRSADAGVQSGGLFPPSDTQRPLF